jgi:CPA1 family monovalent cation:H+ antiporter
MVTFPEFDTILNLLVIIVAITFITRRLRLPRTIVFILGGLVATLVSRFTFPILSPAIFMTILLPPILFEAALTLDVDELRKDADTVFTYAIVGTIMTLLAVAGFVYYFLGFTFIESVLMGIIVAPTDPIAVITSFKRVGTSNKFRVIVEGEALFNDGVAVIAYALILGMIETTDKTIFDLFASSSLAILGGMGLGLLGGYFAHWLIAKTDDKFAEILIGFLLSYGIYRFADEIGSSGVLATVMAGLMLNYRIKNYGGITDEGITQLGTFWDFVGFIASSVAFIFIGLNIQPALLINYAVPILFLTFFIMGSRYIKVQGLSALLAKLRGNSLGKNWKMGLWWAGLRGSISVVLVLSSTSLGLEHIQAMEALTFGLVLTTNAIWGITINYATEKYELRSGPNKAF